jgi:hypothetical protein
MEDLKVLVQAIEIAQQKGCYSLQDAVMIANSIGKLQQTLDVKAVSEDK